MDLLTCRLCQSNQLSHLDEVADFPEKGDAMDLIYFSISKLLNMCYIENYVLRGRWRLI